MRDPKGGVITSLSGGLRGGLFGFADGGVIEGGRPIWGGRVMAFSGGGVLSGPTAFPIRGGGTRVINFHVTTPNADSFRRNKHQIANDMRPLLRGS